MKVTLAIGRKSNIKKHHHTYKQRKNC